MKRRTKSISVVDRLAALSETIRLRLLKLLEAEELSVGEISEALRLPQSTASRHLRTLLDGGWLVKRSEGPATLYRLVHDDLGPEERALWMAVRPQLSADPSFAEDVRRLKAVLLQRRTDSQAFFGRVAGAWDALRSELFGDAFMSVALLSLLPPGLTVADIGCGTGNVAERLAPWAERVIAIDQSDAMLSAARKRLTGFKNVSFVRSPIDPIPLDDASVHAAVCCLVLHHIDDAPNAVRSMARILRPSGVLVLIDMNEHSHDEFRHQMGHRHLGFSRESVRGWLHEAGLVSPTHHDLTPAAGVRGPGLFVATGRAPTAGTRS